MGKIQTLAEQHWSSKKTLESCAASRALNAELWRPDCHKRKPLHRSLRQTCIANELWTQREISFGLSWRSTRDSDDSIGHLRIGCTIGRQTPEMTNCDVAEGARCGCLNREAVFFEEGKTYNIGLLIPKGIVEGAAVPQFETFNGSYSIAHLPTK